VLLKGVFFGIKHAARVMKPQGYGWIISCSSVNGVLVSGENVLYSTCKAAVDHLTRLAASELGPYGIRVNSVVPGAILTPIYYGSLQLTDEMKKDYGDYFMKYQPVKLLGMPIDIAKAVLWLVSDESRFVSGHPLVVDGGISVGFPRVTIKEINEEWSEINDKQSTS
jgi:NAD(P)-dependent dehydrogenase (short-subunit alcohol dehydrogenase family)